MYHISLFQDHVRLHIIEIGDDKHNEASEIIAHMYSF